VPDWLRRAGRGGVGGDDAVVVWSVAEGSHGRRWRWLWNRHQGFLGSVGLIERATDGTLRRLEISFVGGLLTFHPDPDGTGAHGNIVTTEGVRPIATPWRPGWGVGILGDPFGSAIGGWTGSGFVIDERSDGVLWREPGPHADVRALPIDARGVPVLDGGVEWPLELEV
jgi:hypothetical protein